MPYQTKKRWELQDLKYAVNTFFNDKLNDVQKAEVYRNLGRTTGAVHTISYAIRAKANGTHGNASINAAYTVDQARYILGLQDTPFPPKIKPIINYEPVSTDLQTVSGDLSKPETLNGVMALVKFELGKQSSELLLEQASTLEGVLKVLNQIAGSLDAQTQLLSDLYAQNATIYYTQKKESNA